MVLIVKTQKRSNMDAAPRKKLAYKALLFQLSKLPYSHFEKEMARTGYAAWAGISVEFVSHDFICQSALGVPGWAYRARNDMMEALKKAVRNSYSIFSLLPVELIEHMIYDAGRFDYNQMELNKARLLVLGEHGLACQLCARIAKSQARLTKQWPRPPAHAHAHTHRQTEGETRSPHGSNKANDKAHCTSEVQSS
jgi:hypothetical protein